MNRYINRIYRTIIARETSCIKDTETAAICTIACTPTTYTTYVAGTKDYIWANTVGGWLYQKNVCPYLYTLSPLVLRVDEVKWATRSWKLQKVSAAKWQENAWWEQTIGIQPNTPQT